MRSSASAMSLRACACAAATRSRASSSALSRDAAASERLRARPVGWELSDYPPSQPVEGWDEFLGYYQGRTSADA